MAKYIEELYKDFNSKTKIILRYLHMMKENTIATNDDIVNFVKDYEKMHSVMQALTTRSANTVPTDTQFSVEKTYAPMEETPEDLKGLNDSIIKNTPLIEYKFEELIRNLQALTQAYQNYQNVTQRIIGQWEQEIESLQQ